MSTLPFVQGHPTLIDWAKKYDPNGKPFQVAQLLSKSNEFLQILPFMEGNLPTGHKASVQTGLPTPTLRRFYQGVAPSKGSTSIIEDVCAMQEARNEVDKDLADLNGDVNAFRMSEAVPFLEAMSQMAATQFVYGKLILSL